MSSLEYLCKLENEKKLELLFIQVANKERIKKNDILYLFDEVGTGKTISAGICIIEMILSKEYKNILWVSSSRNNLISDTCKKLYKNLDLKCNEEAILEGKKYNIDVIKAHIKDFECLKTNDYDIIIIDEANDFFNSIIYENKTLKGNTKKYKGLEELNAKKTIFLTATPIISAKEDFLKAYSDLGSILTYKNHLKNNNKEYTLEKYKEYNWKILNEKTRNPLDLCTNFDIDSPVTRCFKDINRLIRIENGKIEKKKSKPIRIEPYILDTHKITKSETEEEFYKSIKEKFPYVKDECFDKNKSYFDIIYQIIKKSKEEKIIDSKQINLLLAIINILSIRKTRYCNILNKDIDIKNKIIVYVNTNNECNGQTKEIVKALEYFNKFIDKFFGTNECKYIYKEYHGRTQENDKIQKVVTSDGNTENLPDILITTSSFLESGVDLPGYNYIINYTIPPRASTIEQRFGRIDRLTSNHKHLNMYFIVNSGEKNCTSTKNLIDSLDSFINNTIEKIPSKNCIISKSGLEDMNKVLELRIEYLNELIKINENRISYYEKENLNENEEYIKREKKEIRYNNKAIEDIEKTKNNLEELKSKLEDVSDNIFYRCKNDGKIKTINAEYCLEKIINCEEYKNYENKIVKEIECINQYS